MTKSRKFSTLTQAEKEGNARKGYCASAFFASARDIPAVVSESLPDDAFCTLDDMFKAMRRLEVHLLKLNPTTGLHFVLLGVKEARDLMLTLILADSSIGLSEELDATPQIRAEHTILKRTVEAVKDVVTAAQSGSTSFEDVQDRLDKLPNRALADSVLSLIGQRAPTVQSLAGPIDLTVGKLLVKQVKSNRTHQIQGRVVGGYDEQTGTAVVEVTSLDDADPRLFSEGSRVKVQVVHEEHRMNLLLAQLAKVSIAVKLNIPRIPLTSFSSSRPDMFCDLVTIELLEQTATLNKIKAAVMSQLHLDI